MPGGVKKGQYTAGADNTSGVPGAHFCEVLQLQAQEKRKKEMEKKEEQRDEGAHERRLKSVMEELQEKEEGCAGLFFRLVHSRLILFHRTPTGCRLSPLMWRETG